MKTVWWFSAGLIHYSFKEKKINNASETTTYVLKIN